MRPAVWSVCNLLYGIFSHLLADTLIEQDGFDVITMNMALMDIRELEPLARSLRRLLKQDGW